MIYFKQILLKVKLKIQINPNIKPKTYYGVTVQGIC